MYRVRLVFDFSVELPLKSCEDEGRLEWEDCGDERGSASCRRRCSIFSSFYTIGRGYELVEDEGRGKEGKEGALRRVGTDFQRFQQSCP